MFAIPANVYYVYSTSHFNNVFGILWCTVLSFNNIAAFCSDMQFIRCACMLHYRFETINNHLRAVASNWNFKRE